MGYDFSASAHLGFAWGPCRANPLAAVVAALQDEGYLAGDGGVADPAAAIADAAADVFGAEQFDLTRSEHRLDIAFDACTRLRDQEEALRTFARAGMTGTVTCCGEEESLWRWRLDGVTVHEDTGHIVYDGDVYTKNWLVQLQSADDHELDKVAVVADQREATTLLARWCRAALDAHSDNPVDFTGLDDAGVIDAWTRCSGAVRCRIRQVTARPSAALG